jgi:tryptophan halogenase
MEDKPIRSIVIVGGGTSGWMTASALANKLKLKVKRGDCSIRLVESAEIGIVGVGEATVPHIRAFNNTLGIDEADFMRKTLATIKLGIQFDNWGRLGDSYIHPFGELGRRIENIDFHHYWLKMNRLGEAASIFDYSLPAVAAQRGKFALPSHDTSVFSTYGYAYQFDTNLYGPYLRAYAEARGVKRTEGKVVEVKLRGDDGFIEAIVMASGERIEGDLFIDCSGFRGLLIEQALKTGYEDWHDVLPCNRAVAVACASDGPPPLPLTRATALDAGWQWQIPLQHRTGVGYVYSSDFVSDDDAVATMERNLPGRKLADFIFLKFTGGRRKKSWVRNCVCVGLSGGFIEPLESSGIYLIQQAITALIDMLPDRRFISEDIDEFNRVMDLEYERVRDFVVLHYHATERDDAPLWNYVRNMKIPDSLTYKMKLFRERGHVVKYKDGMFHDASWCAVYLGQRIVPQHYHPLVDSVPIDEVRQHMQDLKQTIDKAADLMPTHQSFIKGYGAAIPAGAR